MAAEFLFSYMTKHNITNIMISAIIGILLFGLGYKTGEFQQSQKPPTVQEFTVSNLDTTEADESIPNIDFSLFWETWRILERKYVSKEDLDPQQMYYGAIKGMVASAEDPYTFFMTPEEHEQSQSDLQGKFEGIGAQLGLEDNLITIIAPLKNSPAEQAGARRGDIIIEVDGKDTQGWTLNEAVNNIRGERGTEVVLTVLRNREEIDLSIIRDEIKVASVELSYEENDSIAYLKLNQFGDDTNSEWDKAVDDIDQKWNTNQIRGMILDLRDNPGGYLDSSVYLASEFIDRGKLVVKQESLDNATDYNVRRNGRLKDIPLVVLINQGSASASEILGGALRDHDRATLVGMKSFGKGSVQEDINLEANAGLRVTVAKWVLPDGDWINGTGIEPDIEIENEFDEENTITKETDEQLKRALEELDNS
jgi:carboxyl-terminal processing protease